MFAFCRELSIIAPFSLVKTDIGFIFHNNSTKVQHVDDFSCAIYRVYQKNRNLGIYHEIDIVLKTKDFRCLGI